MHDQDQWLSGRTRSERVDIAERSRHDAGCYFVQLLREVDIVLFHHFCLGLLSKNIRFILND